MYSATQGEPSVARQGVSTPGDTTGTAAREDLALEIPEWATDGIRQTLQLQDREANEGLGLYVEASASEQNRQKGLHDESLDEKDEASVYKGDDTSDSDFGSCSSGDEGIQDTSPGLADVISNAFITPETQGDGLEAEDTWLHGVDDDSEDGCGQADDLEFINLAMLQSQGMSRSMYECLRSILRMKHIELPSLRNAQRRLQKRTRIVPSLVDCCINNCIAFTGDYEYTEACPKCREQRSTTEGKARAQFLVLPLAQRLRLQYADPERCKILKTYRSTRTTAPARGSVSEYGDVFDGALYRDYLCGSLGMFKSRYDVAIQLSLDGVQVVNKKVHEVTPIIAVNLNLPPEQRYKISNILIYAIIPGPKKPGELNSFLRPVVDELHQLETGGIQVIDGEDNSVQTVKVYVVLVTGDGPATADVMCMKRPGNAYRPCRVCKIEGRQRTTPPRTHYCPSFLGRGALPEPRGNLRPLIEHVSSAANPNICKTTGILGRSELLRLRSIHFPRSFPGDVMHCVLMNVTPMLFELWNRTKLKVDDIRATARPADPMDAGHEYTLNPRELNTIGQMMANARATIPLALGHKPRAIDKYYKGFKAAEWKMWLLYFGAPTLWKILPDKYLANFLVLSRVYRLATQHTLTKAQVSEVGALSSQFVKDFEALYYRGEDDRLPVCTINVHSLLHLRDWIVDCGPACYFWQFPMERFCGILKTQARSKSCLNLSIFNNAITREHIQHVAFSCPDFAYIRDELTVNRQHYPSPTGPKQTQLTMGALRSLQWKLQNETISDPVLFRKVYVRPGLEVGSQGSQRKSEHNREDFRISYVENGRRDFGAVVLYAMVGQDVLAYIKRFSEVKRQTVIQGISFKGEGRTAWIWVQQIEGLIGTIQDQRNNFHLIISEIDVSAPPMER